MLGELDHRAGQQFQGPARAALGWARTGRREQQRLLFARELTIRPRARLFAERRLQVAEHEATLGPVDGRAAHPDIGRDLIVTGADIGSQQNLRSFELARRVFAAAQQSSEFGPLGLAQFDPIAYIHPCLLL
jgi:hypothetical protein